MYSFYFVSLRFVNLNYGLHWLTDCERAFTPRWPINSSTIDLCVIFATKSPTKFVKVTRWHNKIYNSVAVIIYACGN